MMDKYSTRYRVYRAIPKRGGTCGEIARKAFGASHHGMRMRVRYHLLAMVKSGELARNGPRFMRSER